MKVQGVATADMRVIVDGNSEGSDVVMAGDSFSFEGGVVEFRELGIGPDESSFYKAPAEVSGGE